MGNEEHNKLTETQHVYYGPWRTYCIDYFSEEQYFYKHEGRWVEIKDSSKQPMYEYSYTSEGNVIPMTEPLAHIVKRWWEDKKTGERTVGPIIISEWQYSFQCVECQYIPRNECLLCPACGNETIEKKIGRTVDGEWEFKNG